jgi:glyoxylase-like metal-dependent hydrolase (beta-lactamase superfamily II)
MQVAEGVHRLSGGVTNFYVIEDGGRITLIDAGTPGDWDLFIRTLRTLRRTLDDVNTVLLTHAHSDHTGFAERARSEAGATVRVHAEDEALARTGKPRGKNAAGYGRYLLRLEAYRTLLSLLRRGGQKIVPIHEVEMFGDGETLDAPGHTEGSCAVLFERRRALVTGDVMSTRNPLTGRTGPQIHPDALNRDSELALRSLDNLTGLPADVLLPGHGDPWSGSVDDAVRLAKAAGRS